MSHRRIDDDRVVAGRDRIAVRQASRPANVHLPRRDGRVDPQRRGPADDAGDNACRLRHGITDRHDSLPTNERDAVHHQLSHDEHLGQRHLEGTQRLRRRPVLVERALGLQEHHLLEGVHGFQDGVHAAVREAKQLIGSRALEPSEPLAQCGLAGAEGLTVIEIVKRLLRAAQGGILNCLRAERSDTTQSHHRKQDDPSVHGVTPEAAYTACVRDCWPTPAPSRSPFCNRRVRPESCVSPRARSSRPRASDRHRCRQ